jgi:hypothetical protein
MVNVDLVVTGQISQMVNSGQAVFADPFGASFH